jgi:hypothetical protein
VAQDLKGPVKSLERYSGYMVPRNERTPSPGSMERGGILVRRRPMQEGQIAHQK